MVTEQTITLYEAIKKNTSVDELRVILARVSNVNGTSEVAMGASSHMTPLAYACTLKRAEIVSVLLENASETYIRLAFLFAVNHKSGNVDIIKKFISHGVDINIKWSDDDDQSLTTPLLTAVKHGNYELVKYFIRKGAIINHPKSDSVEFPLWVALTSYKTGDPDIIKYLIKNGADVNENDGETLMAIFENANLDHKWEEVFDLCVDHGAKLELQPYMYFACKSSNINMIRYLIARGLSADKEARFNGHIALHIAHSGGKKEHSVIELLLQWGSDPNSQVTPIGDDLYDTFLVGFSALHYACSQADLEKLELLLDYGADVNSVNCSSVTVLFQLLDAVCKDKALYEYMVFSSEHFANDSATGNEMDIIHTRAEVKLQRYIKMTKLLLASGAKLTGDEWMIRYEKPYVVMSVDVLKGSSDFLSRTRSLIECVKTSLREPRSLTDLCRTKIRSLLPVAKRENVTKLNGILPKTVLSVLVFDDILIT